MNTKRAFIGAIIVAGLTLGFFQKVIAADLIVVASQSTLEASKHWLGFLESKEIPVKIVTPNSFSKYKNELFISIIGSVNESGGIAEIAKDALTAEEFESVAKSSQGKMFFKPQAWNVGQKVILFLGPDQAAVDEVRRSTKDDWFEMFQDWFDIEDTEGLHAY